MSGHTTQQRAATNTRAAGAPSTDPELQFIAEALRSEAGAITRLANALLQPEGSNPADPQPAHNWKAALDCITKCTGHIVISGMGKSGLIGSKISATMSSLGVPSHVVHPAEAVHGDLGSIRPDDVALLLSYSGETEEVVNLAAILKADGVARIGISAGCQSTLARLSDVHLCVGDMTEACPLNLAPTASTTAMLAIGDALALAAARRKSFTADDFQRRHPGGLLGAHLKPVTEVLRFRVGENLPVVRDACTVREALNQVAADRRAGAIVLVDEAGRLSGIFTDADFRRLMRHDEHGMDCPMADVMTRHPRHLTSDQLVREAVQLIREFRLDEVPVVDANGHPLGLIDVQDLITLRIVRD